MKQQLVALLWAVHVEATIRRRSLEELCARSGLQLQTAPQDLGANREPLRLSPDDVRMLTAVRRVYRRWPFGGGSCLRESLVAGRLLRYRSPSLCVGVKRVPPGLHMHAWLQLDGAALDPEHVDYRRFQGVSAVG